MRVLILGNQGVVGAAIEKQLSSSSCYEIYGLDRKDLDCSDFKKVERELRLLKANVVINSVGKVAGVSGNLRNPFQLVSENAITSAVVAKAAFEVGIERLIYFAPACIYPNLEMRDYLSEEDIWQGEPEISSRAYASSKLMGTELIRAANIERGLNWRVLIPTNLFGYGDWKHGSNGHVISMLSDRFIKAKRENREFVSIWGSGEAKRDFLSAKDFAIFIDHFLKHYDKSDELTNVPGYGEIDIKSLAGLISDQIGYKGKIFFDSGFPEGAKRKVLSSDSLKKLGFEHKASLAEALKEYLFHFCSATL